ncbi:hypothetical protein BpHYR1_053720 [Brachionus plicatilis]|uniref:Uncharacterized protein n=1 Tax=Brachionus plicatilis TaxID=10195 RepID=A0A3M7RY02_BRAPC|nr:hypothetical protein BpHYR1_053720 [Brachionus plicatilis]
MFFDRAGLLRKSIKGYIGLYKVVPRYNEQVGRKFLCSLYRNSFFYKICNWMWIVWFYIFLNPSLCSNIFAFDERIVDIVDVFTPFSLESVVSQARYNFFFFEQVYLSFFSIRLDNQCEIPNSYLYLNNIIKKANIQKIKQPHNGLKSVTLNNHLFISLSTDAQR